MNNKGIFAIKMIMFILASMIVSIIIILFFARAVPRIMTGTIEEVVAKDFGLAIMTLSASPYDITYAYDKNTEKYDVLVDEEEVIIQSDEASGKYKYLPMLGVTVKEGLMQGILSIPMSMKDKTLSFTNENSDFTDSCANIPMTFSEDNLDVKIVVDVQVNGDAKKNLDMIKGGIGLKASLENKNIRITESNQDLTIFLTASNTDKVSVQYYEDGNDPETAWVHRIACYNTEMLSDNHPEIGEVSMTSFTQENTINIDFGNTFTKTDSSITVKTASTEIYQALELGMKK